jgi:hypothetical protein
MDNITIKFDYKGALVEANIFPEENCIGIIYPIEMHGNYAFTVYVNENEDWQVMKENNANIPSVDTELLNSILKKLQWQLLYAA